MKTVKVTLQFTVHAGLISFIDDVRTRSVQPPFSEEQSACFYCMRCVLQRKSEAQLTGKRVEVNNKRYH